MHLDILSEDDDIILINKSPGVVVHPGAGNYENTIVNGLMFYCKNQLSNIGDISFYLCNDQIYKYKTIKFF